MDPVSVAALTAAVNAAASGVVSGAAGEAGRRAWESLAGLSRRVLGRGSTAGGVAPEDEVQRRELAELLAERSRRDPGFAHEVESWLRDTAGLARAAVAPGASRPQLLPAATAVFTDRDRERAELMDLAGGAGLGIGLITGSGGIGKTAMAVRLAHDVRPDFPAGQLYADLRGASADTAATPSDVLVRFLHRLGVPPEQVPPGEEAQADLYRDCTAGRRLLVLLDNVRSAAQIGPRLTGGPGSFILVTSRHRLPELVGGYGARTIRLGPLSAEDGERLLVRIVGEERFAARRSSAAAVARHCGGMPLALCATGARVAVREHLSWELLEREFTDQPKEDAAVPDADPAHLAADLSYRDLTPAAARLYRLLGLRPWPAVAVGAAAAAAGTGTDEARTLLEELASVHLLEENGEERYRLHDVIRRHAEAQAQREDGRAGTAAAVRRMAMRAAEEYGFDELAWQLCEAMWGLHLRLGFHEQWAATHRFGVDAAVRCADFGDPRAEGRMRTQLAFAFMGLGRLDDAERELTAAAEADRRAGHRRGEATTVESLGLLRLRQWRYEDAAGLFERAREIIGSIGAGQDGEKDVPRARALLAHHIGRALRGQGRYEEAERQLRYALGEFQALDEPDRYNEARVLTSLAETHLAAGSPAAARPALDEALDVLGDEGALLMRADAAELRARCARELGDAAEEARFLRLACALHEEAGDAGEQSSPSGV